MFIYHMFAHAPVTAGIALLVCYWQYHIPSPADYHKVNIYYTGCYVKGQHGVEPGPIIFDSQPREYRLDSRFPFPGPWSLNAGKGVSSYTQPWHALLSGATLNTPSISISGHFLF